MSLITRRIAALGTLPLAVGAALALTVSPASAAPLVPPAPASNMVISQVSTQGPGGVTDEFVELHNTGPQSMDISNFSVWACSNSGQHILLATVPAGTILSGTEEQQPETGQYYLLAAQGYERLTPPDQTYNGNIARTGGVLLRGTPNIENPMGARVDSVGFSATNICTETAPAPAQTTNFSDQSVLRVADQDTNNNAFDFRRVAPAMPRNSSSS
ncbi:lamin tail-like protein [Krasilnikovia cinnamomea]|uniref:Lamin tail-like protein n=1 Tax=Krasilnikovia cinnamomea TaxID=349313 RepID=A0A4V2G7U7_9ACTN|nr:lamin tail domain-containing protein [Krasilnikovia cinnamomea]RZU53976.1 lamin tail-like protein [Krasilnikovia cinnamomea]